MTLVESQYFALLRAALWGSPVAIDEVIDWKTVMKIAEYHGNNGLLSDVAVRMTGDNKPAPQMLAKMQTTLRNGLFYQLRQRQILVSAVQLLREHGIEPVLLKGFGLALLYPNPSLRQFGDIDLFVGLDKFHEACTLLRTLPGGYNWGEEIDIGRHYNIEFGHCPMEVHRLSADIDDPKTLAVYEPIEHDGLEENPCRSDVDGFEITVPSNEFQVFFTFFHAWKHFLTTGVGWRQVSDVTMALHVHHGQLDLYKLRRWIDSMHLMKPWQAFGWLMVNTLGLPQDEMPFYTPRSKRTAQKLCRRIMATGNFNRRGGLKAPSKKHRLLHKMHALLTIFKDFFYRARVFPGAAFREMKASLRFALSKRKNNKKNE
jgi:hypothetical protein